LLYALRAKELRSRGKYDSFSREVLLIGNNVMLCAATIVVLLGTLLPLVHKELGLGTISVGAPFFNQMFTILVIPFVFMLSLGPLSRWKRQPVSGLRNHMLVALGVSVSAAILLNFGYDQPTYMAVLGLVLSFWILVSTVQEVLQRVNAQAPQRSRFQALKSLTRSHWGMVLGHVGFAVCLIGITLVSNYEQERDVRMLPGDRVTIAGYDFEFIGVKPFDGPNYIADIGIFDVFRDGDKITQLEPEKRFYPVQRTTMTEAGIHATISRDLFVALGESLDGDAWAVRVYIKPFVTWIWAGAFIMALGGAMSIADKRYRLAKAASKQRQQTPTKISGTGEVSV
jgi:cytochrome c-type biogenesis protein CcmF